MNYAVLMTIAGSTLFIGYLCWEKLCRRFLTQGTKYKVLTVVLLVYAVPWVWLRRVYSRISVLPVRELKASDIVGPVRIANLSAEAEAYRTQDYQKMLSVARIWLAGALLFMAVKLCIYFYSRWKLVSMVNEDAQEIPEAVLEELKQEFRCKRMPEIYQVPGSLTMTVGAVKPVIFLQEDYTGKELDFILRHEMTHIVRGDLVIKLLLELVCCLHWFNLLIYFLKSRFEFACETSCDERVLRGYTKKEREAYARLVVRSAVEDKKKKLIFGSAFGNGCRIAEKRVRLIMTSREAGRGKLLALGCFSMMLFADSLTALAYPAVQYVEDATVKAAETSVDGDIFWGYDRYEDAEMEYDASEFLVLYDEQFIDEESNIYLADSINLQVICFKHNIVSGYYSAHNVNDDGSCIIEIYESTKCTNCNAVWQGELDHTTTYTKCPHNY